MLSPKFRKLRFVFYIFILYSCVRIFNYLFGMVDIIEGDSKEDAEKSLSEISPLFDGKSYFPTDEGGDSQDGYLLSRREYVWRNFKDDTEINKTTMEKRKLILFWSKFFGKKTPNFPSGTKKFESCPTHTMFNKCFLTYDRSRLNEAGVVVLHAFDLMNNKSDVPPFRNPDHVWVIYGTEAPSYASVDQRFNGMFNFTMTYRKDADFYYNYGDMITKKEPERDKPVPDMTRNKTKLVAWANSHCSTESHREDYVAELQKHVPVDIFGYCTGVYCGNKKTIEGHKICAEKLSPYKFYLALENSMCYEYVTEKAYRAMDYGLVPVVLGNSDYRDFLPHHSYIDIRDFSSPKHLAEYLKKVDKDDALYNKYMEWRGSYKTTGSTYHFCEMCHTLNTEHALEQVYTDIYRWWNSGCLTAEEFYKGHFDHNFSN